MSCKRIFLPVLVLAIGLFGLSGCTKKKDDPSGGGGTGKAFYMKLDGVVFEPATGGKYNAVGGGASYQIAGYDASTTIEIRVSSVAVGTYPLGASSTSNYASVYYSAGGKEYVSTTGEVKITKSAGDKISGTFHYTATGTAGTVQVTEGEFNDIPKK